MRAARIIGIVLGVLCWPSVPADSATVSLNLGIEPSSTLDATLRWIVFDDTETTQLGGNLLVNVEWTAVGSDAEVTGISFVGGTVTATDVTFNLGPANFTTSGMGGNITTPTPPGSVSLAGSQFDAAEHRFTVNQGAVNVTGIVTTTINLTTSPVVSDLSGTGSISLVEVSRLGNQVTYDLGLDVPMNFSGSLGSTPVNLSATGSIATTPQQVVLLVPESPTSVLALLCIPALTFWVRRVSSQGCG